jgi:Tol biopolymer transport system component
LRPWDWTPDGQKLIYLLPEGRDNRPQARIAFGMLDVATRQKSVYVDHPGYDVARPRFSPDGQWIAFAAIVRPGFNHIMIMPFEVPAPGEDRWIPITDAATFNDKPVWSPDGNLLYFTSDSDGYRCIYARRLDPKTKRPSGDMFAVHHSHNARRSLMNIGFQFMDISLSREKIYFNLGETTGNIWLAKVPSPN